MDNNLAARIVRAARNPETVAPRNGHKESDTEWAERVVRYVLADAEAEIDRLRKRLDGLAAAAEDAASEFRSAGAADAATFARSVAKVAKAALIA